MSSGAKQTLQICPETIIGTTPTPFARTTIPFTNCTLKPGTTTTESGTILDQRIARGSIITGYEYAGDIECEAEYGTFDVLLAAAAYNDWQIDSPVAGTDTLTFGGTIRKTFSAMRGYTDISEYHTFKGLHVSKFSMKISESDKINFTFSMMGTDYQRDTSVPMGTVTPWTPQSEFSSINLGTILIDGASTQNVACITAINFDWDNGLQTQRCLGNGGKPQAQIETVTKGTGSFDLAFSAKAADILNKQMTNGAVALVIPFTDSAGNNYTLTLPEVEVKGDLPTGKNTEILKATVNFTVRHQAPTLSRTPHA